MCVCVRVRVRMCVRMCVRVSISSIRACRVSESCKIAPVLWHKCDVTFFFGAGGDGGRSLDGGGGGDGGHVCKCMCDEFRNMENEFRPHWQQV